MEIQYTGYKKCKTTPHKWKYSFNFELVEYETEFQFNLAITENVVNIQSPEHRDPLIILYSFIHSNLVKNGLLQCVSDFLDFEINSENNYLINNLEYLEIEVGKTYTISNN